MTVIELQEIHKHYHLGGQTIRALDGVDLEIETGEFCAIIGPSGSGKSTLMHLLGCLDTPTRGQLIVDGVDISKASPSRLSHIRNSKIGFVFQSFNLLPKLNVMQNVELPLIYAGMGKAKRREKTMACVREVGLEDRVHNRPLQLSGGQCQRAAIARALVNDPRIILADEPTGNLDTSNGEAIITLFRQLHAAGRTIILVTHDPEVAAVAERVIEIRDGKIVAGAKPLSRQPAPAGTAGAVA